MLLHTIVQTSTAVAKERGIEVTHEDVLFGKFIRREIFPGGQLCVPEVIIDHAERAGFTVTRVHSLQLHYARTLEQWAVSLEAARDEAIAVASRDVYELYMKYLVGCARYFRSGHLDLMQFTLCGAGS
jgi:cyclopropane-fatty-acyl-phospholipid synthase